MTGKLVAGGTLLPHENTKLDQLCAAHHDSPRSVLNLHSLTDQGLDELRQLLDSGRYRIDVPEEAALLVVAYLLDQGETNDAFELLDQLEPFHAQLRFYPAPSETPVEMSDRVHLQTVGDAVQSLRAVTDRDRIRVQNETLRVWIPLFDRFVDLVLETVVGDAPSVSNDPDSCEPVIEGGSPFQRFEDAWYQRAACLLAEYTRLRRVHRLASKPDRRGENFCDLRRLVERSCEKSFPLSEREISRARTILVRDAHKRGQLGSSRRRELRSEQDQISRLPTRIEFAKLLVARLATADDRRGLDAPEHFTGPVTTAEADFHSISQNRTIPDSLARHVSRCLDATVDELVEQGLVTSSDVLAELLPQISSGVQARGFDDPVLQRLFASTYRAFRRRRSLLLLDLQSQTRFEDLPWIAALDRWKTTDSDEQQASLRTYVEAARLTLTSFPHAIVPNTLLQEFRSLGKSARQQLPLVDELATDIFMGKFTVKFLDAAEIAQRQLAGTLYDRYYGLTRQSLPVTRGRSRVAEGFAELCARRAGVSLGGWNAAVNGMIIEQQQILTTQNLASLYTLPGLKAALEPELVLMAHKTFRWICRRLKAKSNDHHGRLITIKHVAYAWRQMVFFLSHVADRSVIEWLEWCEEENRSQGRMLGGEIDELKKASLGDDVHRIGPLLGWSTPAHRLLVRGDRSVTP